MPNAFPAYSERPHSALLAGGMTKILREGLVVGEVMKTGDDVVAHNLVQAGLIISRRDGRNLFYSPNFARMKALVGFLTENCCSLADEACDASCRPLPAVSQRKRA